MPFLGHLLIGTSKGLILSSYEAYNLQDVTVYSQDGYVMQHFQPSICLKQDLLHASRDSLPLGSTVVLCAVYHNITC